MAQPKRRAPLRALPGDRLDVVVVMGSKSDWETMKNCRDVLREFGLQHECRALSAHRTPEALVQFLRESEQRGARAVIAAAGGAAHLAGVCAAHTTLPVLGVPMDSALDGLDSLLSTVQMPKGIPVATFAIGKAGAANAALFVVAMLAGERPALQERLAEYRRVQADKVLSETLE